MWWSNIWMNFVCFSPEGRGLVSKSATLPWVLMYAVLHSFFAQPSLTKWYAMALDFFFSMDAGAEVLAKTDWLSPNTEAGSSTVILIMPNLKRRPRTYSVACLIAMNSLPKVLVSQDPCFFKLHYIGALFKNTMNLVQEQWVIKSRAWSLSTYTLIVIDGPWAVGMPSGSVSDSPS